MIVHSAGQLVNHKELLTHAGGLSDSGEGSIILKAKRKYPQNY